MKTIQVRILGPEGKRIHDGEGGKHLVGSVVALPEDVATALISAGAAKIADGKPDYDGRDKADEIAGVAQKADAEAAMKRHDRAPKAIRDLSKEYGDDVLRLYRTGLTADQILEELTKPSTGDTDAESA